MGLRELVKSGSTFTRKTITLSNVAGNRGYSEAFGTTYILLNISSSVACRVRLYGTSGSIQVDSSRPSSSFDFSASVMLNLDVGLTPDTQSIQFNPPIIGSTLGDFNRTWYNIESATPTDVAITVYPIELNTGSRRYFSIPNFNGVTLAGNASSSGNFTGSSETNLFPRSFLPIAAFSDSSSLRLRLYSQPIEKISDYERTRRFDTASLSGSHLIVDFLYDSRSYQYPISPVPQGYNLEDYLVGNNQVGYILQNLSASPQSNILTSVLVYPVQD